MSQQFGGRESGSWNAALDLCKNINPVVKLQEEGDRGQACGREAGGCRSDRGCGLRLRGVDMKVVATVIQRKWRDAFRRQRPSLKRHATSLRFPRESRTL